MKTCISGLKLVAAILCFPLLPTVSAQTPGIALVGCPGGTPGGFTSINAALASLPPAGPNAVFITGTCQENVIVSGFTNLLIAGNPSATIQPATPNGHPLEIFNSQRVTIQGTFLGTQGFLTFDGGRGVTIADNSRVDLQFVNVQNSKVTGITSRDSAVHFFTGTVQNNRTGISITGGTFSLDNAVAVTGNARLGISVVTGHLILNGGDGVTPGTENVISNNGLLGVQVASSAEADIFNDNRIINNGSNGGQFALLVLNGSSIAMAGGIISGNTGLGVHCGGTSHCEFGGGTQIDNNTGGGMEIVEHSDASIDGGNDISGNTGNGILVDQGSSLSSLGGNTINNNSDDGILVNNLSVLKFFAAADTITGNMNDSVECANMSLVAGNISTLTKVKCGTIATPVR